MSVCHRLQTRVNRLPDVTCFALDLATPVERARTPLHHNNLLRTIATAAAHQIATVDTNRRVVALTAVRALDAQTRVLRAEARRRFQIDEVPIAGRFVLGIVGF